MIKYNGIKFATNDSEHELVKLYKIKRLKKAVLYFIDECQGFGFNSNGVAFQFTTLENGKKFYQHTLVEDKESFAAEYLKEKKPDWSNTTWFFD